jgi:vacuolar protein sorting-associated protein 13A/C
MYMELKRTNVDRAVTKPVVGMFDLANNVSQGVRNTTTIFDANDIDRLRLPRYIAGDGILRVSAFISL